MSVRAIVMIGGVTLVGTLITVQFHRSRWVNLHPWGAAIGLAIALSVLLFISLLGRDVSFWPRLFASILFACVVSIGTRYSLSYFNR